MPRNELVNVFAEITDPAEMNRFFGEIFTPKERDALTLRWRLLKELHEGRTQRDIAARHGISLCKITRGSKVLKQKNSVVMKILDRRMENPVK
ncbi:MAG: transcriptional regulator [Deltaproteobacteria bacterium]|nr:transcriptional regulator [Deltaproteobacteria bacterium]